MILGFCQSARPTGHLKFSAAYSYNKLAGGRGREQPIQGSSAAVAFRSQVFLGLREPARTHIHINLRELDQDCLPRYFQMRYLVLLTLKWQRCTLLHFLLVATRCNAQNSKWYVKGLYGTVCGGLCDRYWFLKFQNCTGYPGHASAREICCASSLIYIACDATISP